MVMMSEVTQVRYMKMVMVAMMMMICIFKDHHSDDNEDGNGDDDNADNDLHIFKDHHRHLFVEDSDSQRGQ